MRNITKELLRAIANHGVKIVFGLLLRSAQKSLSSLTSLGISNTIMNLLKFRSGKLINKRVDIFFIENLIKVMVSHLAVKTYYPFAKRVSKNLVDSLSGGRIIEETLEKIL